MTASDDPFTHQVRRWYEWPRGEGEWPDGEKDIRSVPDDRFVYGPSEWDSSYYIPVGLAPAKPDSLPEAPPRKQATRRPSPDTPHTYLIGIEGSPMVKIGYTTNPQKRLESLQTAHPMELSLLWSQPGDHEKALHLRFADYRVRGEWFDLTPLGDPAEAVKAAVEEINQAAATRTDGGGPVKPPGEGS